MKTSSLYLALFVFALGLPAFSQSRPEQSRVYLKPSGPIGNFTLLVPGQWKKKFSASETDESYTFSRDRGTIRVRAFISDSDIMSLLRLKKQEIASIDPSFKPIISNEKITIRKSIEGKLLVYEFRDLKAKTPIIQRTFITTQGDCVYIIDCRAPSVLFHKYSGDFTAAMGSFALTGASKYNGQVQKAGTKGKTEIQPEPVKKDSIHINDDEISKMGLEEDVTTENKDGQLTTIPGPSGKPTDTESQPDSENTGKAQDSAPAR